MDDPDPMENMHPARLMPIRLTVLEDDPRQREAVVSAVAKDRSYVCVGQFGSLMELKRAVPTLRCDVVLVDIQLPDGTGIQALQWLKAMPPRFRGASC